MRCAMHSAATAGSCNVSCISTAAAVWWSKQLHLPSASPMTPLSPPFWKLHCVFFLQNILLYPFLGRRSSLSHLMKEGEEEGKR